jgi:type IV secretion system protein TrbL
MVAGGAAAGGGRAIASGALGAIQAGTAMGAAASTAYGLGQSSAASPGVGAGLAGVGRVAGSALRARMSDAFGLGEAASAGRGAAHDAFGSAHSPSPASGGGETMPGWARDLQSSQTARHRRQLAVHAVQQGDRGGASATPDIKERND